LTTTEAKPSGDPLHVALLLPDPRLPYTFAKVGRLGEEDAEAARQVEEALGELEGYRSTVVDDHERMVDILREGGFDLALNFADTGYRNQDILCGHVASLCEIAGLPYTGSPAIAIDVAADKALARLIAIELGIPVPGERLVDLAVEPYPLPDAYPAMIKPNWGGGSLGVTRRSVVHDAAEAESVLRWLAETVTPAEAVIQEFLTGAEYTVSVVDDPRGGLKILPPSAIDYSGLDPGLPPIFTYGAKFDSSSPYWHQLQHERAELDEATLERLRGACLKLFTRLRCRDYARIDFRCDADGVPRLLDVNPNPTWHHGARLHMTATWGGYEYPDLLRLILDSAAARYGLRPA